MPEQGNEITLVFDHPDFMVVNKPAGIGVHKDQQHNGILPLLYQQLGINQLWLVHRLDKVTSGLLILAKHAQSAAALSQLFAERQIHKYYLALSDKKPKKKQGSIIGDMKKVRDGKWILTQQKQNPAISQFFSHSVGTGKRLFIVKPYTGKTHQIRVALKSLGSPILGDEMYGGNSATRTYLHAYALDFIYQQQQIQLQCLPETGDAFAFTTEQQALGDFALPWQLPWPKVKVSAKTPIPDNRT